VEIASRCEARSKGGVAFGFGRKREGGGYQDHGQLVKNRKKCRVFWKSRQEDKGGSREKGDDKAEKFRNKKSGAAQASRLWDQKKEKNEKEVREQRTLSRETKKKKKKERSTFGEERSGGGLVLQRTGYKTSLDKITGGTREFSFIREGIGGTKKSGEKRKRGEKTMTRA